MNLGKDNNASIPSFDTTTEKFPVYLIIVIAVVILVAFLLIAIGVYCFYCRDRGSENNTVRKERSKKRNSQKKTINNSTRSKHHRLSHRRGRDSSRRNRNSQSRGKQPVISSKVARMTSSEVIKLPPNVKLT